MKTFFLPLLSLAAFTAFTSHAAELNSKLDDDGKSLRLSAGGKPVFQYNHAPVARPALKNENHTRNAYLHPVWTPSGKIITDEWCGFGGDAHWHHRGIWFAWTSTKINGKPHDFWNIGAGSGKVFFKSFAGKSADGSGFVTEHEWRVGGGVTNTTYGDVVLRERWNVKLVDATPQQFVFDITSHQEALVPIQLPAYRYGGMAFRGAAQWLPKTAPFRVLTSEGHDRKSGDGARARWFHAEGEIDGATVGFAMLDAPTNKNHPSPMRLNPEIPYLGFFPFRNDEFTIQPGQPIEFRYRMIVHDGKLAPEKIESAWKGFATQK